MKSITTARRTAQETIRLGVIMNGVTGRMGANQHLARSIVAIREAGGIPAPGGRVIWPDPEDPVPPPHLPNSTNHRDTEAQG